MPANNWIWFRNKSSLLLILSELQDRSHLHPALPSPVCTSTFRHRLSHHPLAPLNLPSHLLRFCKWGGKGASAEPALHGGDNEAIGQRRQSGRLRRRGGDTVQWGRLLHRPVHRNQERREGAGLWRKSGAPLSVEYHLLFGMRAKVLSALFCLVNCAASHLPPWRDVSLWVTAWRRRRGHIKSQRCLQVCFILHFVYIKLLFVRAKTYSMYSGDGLHIRVDKHWISLSCW